MTAPELTEKLVALNDATPTLPVVALAIDRSPRLLMLSGTLAETGMVPEASGIVIVLGAVKLPRAKVAVFVVPKTSGLVSVFKFRDPLIWVFSLTLTRVPLSESDELAMVWVPVNFARDPTTPPDVVTPPPAPAQLPVEIQIVPVASGRVKVWGAENPPRVMVAVLEDPSTSGLIFEFALRVVKFPVEGTSDPIGPGDAKVDPFK